MKIEEAWSKFKSDFLEKANLDNERNLGDHAIIDHDSPSHELNCSYNIDEIKLVIIYSNILTRKGTRTRT